MHGGAKGSGAPKGKDNGRYQRGMFTCEAIQRRREIRALIAEMLARADPQPEAPAPNSNRILSKEVPG